MVYVPDPANYEMKKNVQTTSSAQQQLLAPIDAPLSDLPADEVITLVGSLAPLATASLEAILRNPTQYPSQAVAAAKLVYERKLGAIPDTVVQNNMQFVVKWKD